MNNKKKVATLLTLLASTTLVIGTVVAVQSNGFSNFMTMSESDNKVTLNASNGKTTVSSLKTNNVAAKTFKNNDVSFDYKNNQVVEGKVTKILAGGFYRNRSPLHDMQSIRVVSDAGTGDAKIYYGKSSAYMTEFVDLAEAAEAKSIDGANFFKIEATNDVEITSIEVGFGCDTKDYGPVAQKADDTVLSNGYKFTASSDHYEMKRDKSSDYAVATRVIVPDYYGDASNQKPVTVLQSENSCGTFEDSTSLQEIYLPETITTFGTFLFYSDNYPVTEFTMPLELTAFYSNPLPRNNLVTLNIHSRRAVGSIQYITSSKATHLETINVSYDVELLPNIVESWPSSVQTINYEGTETEWETLLSASNSKWAEFPGVVYCSDTVFADVTLHYDGATLNSIADTSVISTKVGKTFAEFGDPVYNDGTKRFAGWYTSAIGGTPISFPYSVTGDADIYAHFEDYGAGSSFDNPIDVLLGQSYSYSTDATHKEAFFRYTASSNDEVIKVTITSAASAFGEYIYHDAYASAEESSKYSIGNTLSASDNTGKVSSVGSYSYGLNNPLRVRLAANESVYIKIHGNDDNSRIGSFTINFSSEIAGSDYTTASVYTAGDMVVPQKQNGLTWYKFTPASDCSYLFNGNSTAWCGGDMGHFVAGVWTADTTGSDLNVSSGLKRSVLNLTGGITYYFAFQTSNAALTFSLSDELDPGMSKDTAITLSVDGATEMVGYDSDFKTTYYKFTAADAGKYRLVADSKVTINPSSGYYKVTVVVTDSSNNNIPLSAGRTNHDKVIDVTAGVYYIAITTADSSSCKDFAFGIETFYEDATVKVFPFGPGTSATTTEVVDAGKPYVLADPTYDKQGHTYFNGFDGWYKDAAFTQPFTSGDIITGNTDIYAKSTGKYYSDVLNDLDTKYGTYVDLMQSSSSAYPFYKDGNNYISTNEGVNSSSSEISFVAKADIKITVSFEIAAEFADKIKIFTRNTIGGTETEVFSARGDSVSGTGSVNLSTGMVADVRFAKDNSGHTSPDKLTITNVLVEEISKVSLTYNFCDGVTADDVVNVLPNTAITNTHSSPTREDYRFDGWFTDSGVFEDEFNFSTGISSNTTIYAKWVEQVTVTFYENGPANGVTSTVKMDKNGTISLSSLNTSYYTGFEGWFTDSSLTQKIENGDTVTENISVYAKHKYSGKYRMDSFDAIDNAYPGVFSNITGTTNAYYYRFADGVFTSGCTNVGGGTSKVTLTLAADYYVSFDWEVSSESDWDKGTITITDGSVVTKPASGVSGTDSDTYNSGTTVLHAGTTIEFYYSKDGSGNTGKDTFVIKNLVFTAA